MKKFAIIGRLGLIIVIIGWTGCSDLSVSNDSAQNIEGAFGLKLGEVYEKEVDENYAAAFTPSEPVKPFTFYALVVVPSTKKICFITASAKFDDYDQAKRQEEVLMRVIAKKHNAKFQQGLSVFVKKFVDAAEKVRTYGKTMRLSNVEEMEREGIEMPIDIEELKKRLRQAVEAQQQAVQDQQKVLDNQVEYHLRKGSRVINIGLDFTGSFKLRLSYGDEDLMKSAIEEKKRKKEEKEESEINVEGL